jgi:hypothetical protein
MVRAMVKTLRLFATGYAAKQRVAIGQAGPCRQSRKKLLHSSRELGNIWDCQEGSRSFQGRSLANRVAAKGF